MSRAPFNASRTLAEKGVLEYKLTQEIKRTFKDAVESSPVKVTADMTADQYRQVQKAMQGSPSGLAMNPAKKPRTTKPPPNPNDPEAIRQSEEAAKLAEREKRITKPKSLVDRLRNDLSRVT